MHKNTENHFNKYTMVEFYKLRYIDRYYAYYINKRNPRSHTEIKEKKERKNERKSENVFS